MGEISRKPKEIRVVFNLNNESDKALYETLKEFTQPGKIIKKIVSENIDNIDNTTKIKEEGIVNSEILKILSKISDKLDNLSVVQSTSEVKESKENEFNQVELTATVSSNDLDDIDF